MLIAASEQTLIPGCFSPEKIKSQNTHFLQRGKKTSQFQEITCCHSSQFNAAKRSKRIAPLVTLTVILKLGHSACAL